MLIKSILAALAAVALVVAVAVVFKKYGQDDAEPDGATASHTGAMISALFLLIFAIAVIVPWTVADEARKNTSAEAQALTETYWDAAGLPGPERQQVRDDIKGYINHVIDKEWPEMQKGHLSPAAWQRIEALRIKLAGFNFKDESASDVRDDALERIREVSGARRQRASDAESGLPDGVLFFTVVTGIVMILFPFLIGARPKGMPLVSLGIMAAMLGVSMYLVFDINHAFSGSLAVQPAAFQDALTEMARIP